jgi:hypothetical protein
MANFSGGSAPAMATQIAEGFVVLNNNSLKTFAPGDLAALRQELEKLQRDARAVVPAQDDALAQQSRNRRITRLGSAIQMVAQKMMARR